jgi:bifunctional ADP-heptose synthase (sugar kinase/adenylyltransferase)
MPEAMPGARAVTPAPKLTVVPRAQLGAARVLVVGDVMLDRYWFGDVNRISPEAPVPVVHVQRQEDRLGGAANVAPVCYAWSAMTNPANASSSCWAKAA